MDDGVDVDKVRRVFEDALGEARRDWLLGTVLTIVFLPLLLAAAAAVLVFMIGVDVVGEVATRPSAALVAVEVFLGFLFLGYFLGEPGRTRWPLVGVAAAGLAALVVLAHVTPLPRTAPGPFWAVYGLGVFGLLGVLGLAYTPRDDYDLGLGRYMINRPFTLHDDIDRAHFGLGFLVAIPRFVLGAASDVVSGSWALRGLSPHEVRGASAALLALGRGDAAGAHAQVGRLGPTAASRVRRALEGAKLLRPGGHLTPKATRLLASSGASLVPLR